MNLLSSSVPCNLAPKPHRASSRRRPRHASRPFPSLSFSSPALLPEGCTRWRVFQLRRSTQKVCKLENCLARLASRFSFEPLSLSSCTVSVCRELYLNPHDTSSQFLKKFSLFCQIFHKPLKIQHKNFAFFYTKFRISGNSSKISKEK